MNTSTGNSNNQSVFPFYSRMNKLSNSISFINLATYSTPILSAFWKGLSTILPRYFQFLRDSVSSTTRKDPRRIDRPPFSVCHGIDEYSWFFNAATIFQLHDRARISTVLATEHEESRRFLSSLVSRGIGNVISKIRARETFYVWAAPLSFSLPTPLKALCDECKTRPIAGDGKCCRRRKAA